VQPNSSHLHLVMSSFSAPTSSGRISLHQLTHQTDRYSTLYIMRTITAPGNQSTFLVSSSLFNALSAQWGNAVFVTLYSYYDVFK
jgi:hypothetical protein